MYRHAAVVLLALFAALASPAAQAADPEFHIGIRDHRFVPDSLDIPANVRVRLVIENGDATPEEFESHELNREKVIPGHAKGIVYVGPLKPGTYPFFGEFHEETAQGRLMVR